MSEGEDRHLILEVKNYHEEQFSLVRVLLSAIAGDFDFTLRWTEQHERKTLHIVARPRSHITGRPR